MSDILLSDLKIIKKDISTLTKQVLDISDTFITPKIITKSDKLIQKVGCMISNFDNVKTNILSTLFSFINEKKGIIITILIFTSLIFIIPLTILFLMIGFYSCSPVYVTILSYILTLLFISFCILLIIKLTKDDITTSTNILTNNIIKNLDNICK